MAGRNLYLMYGFIEDVTAVYLVAYSKITALIITTSVKKHVFVLELAVVLLFYCHKIKTQCSSFISAREE